MSPAPKVVNYGEPVDKYQVHIQKTASFFMKQDLLDLIMYYIKAAQPNECMWYSLIDRVVLDDGNRLVYTISDLFIPEQIVDDRNVEATPDGVQKMWAEIKSLRSLSMSEVGDLMGRAKFWGHSHVKMQPSPSPEDDKMWNQKKEDCKKDPSKRPTGMIIFSVDGRFSNRVYDPLLDIELHNIKLFIQNETDFSYIDTALANKMTLKPKPPVTQTVVQTSPGVYQTTTSHSPTPAASTGSWYSRDSNPLPANSYQDKDSTKKNTTSTTTLTESARKSQVRAEKQEAIKRAKEEQDTVRGAIPHGLLMKHSRAHTDLVYLESQAARTLIKYQADPAEVIKCLQHLETLKPNQIAMISKGVDKLVEYLTGDSRSDTIKYIDMAIRILDRLDDEYEDSPVVNQPVKYQNMSTITSDICELLSDTDTSIMNIASFFKDNVIHCNELFVFAFSIVDAHFTRFVSDPAAGNDITCSYIDALGNVYYSVCNYQYFKKVV